MVVNKDEICELNIYINSVRIRLRYFLISKLCLSVLLLHLHPICRNCIGSNTTECLFFHIDLDYVIIIIACPLMLLISLIVAEFF